MKAKAIKFTEFRTMNDEQLNDIERKIYAQLKRYLLADEDFQRDGKKFFGEDFEAEVDYASKVMSHQVHEFGWGYGFFSPKHYDDMQTCDVRITDKKIVIVDIDAVYHWLFDEFFE